MTLPDGTKVPMKTVTLKIPDNERFRAQLRALEYSVKDELRREKLLGRRVKVLNVSGMTMADWYKYAIGETGVITWYSKGHTGIKLDSGKTLDLYPNNYRLLSKENI